ncbi:SPOR domain-containing protein [Sphingomicrobium astaxanthinifaciens]|uniref:SPOR domain-containing protein n=1 Tax=Sphingomicrobium astaxanthinifaciens TaxID=1227949 RepID=UPI001FCAB4BA|nr:SPOR domain-containing protein [Sphingomicrobium astaxanthinifaciens]MCJ7420279.1 tetratricopeptide repeat protein [Sphingomicrobium astaxanthinifaciens]
MSKITMGRAVGLAAMAAALGACGMSDAGMGGFAGKMDKENIGLASRAQGALIEGNHAEAIALAERAVEASPTDAGFRALLGNIYFADGRFASAEAAYRDSLSLMPAQPKIIMKKALVEIAQGKRHQALAGLEQARGYVDAADLGLAVAMAGRPQVALEILETAARSPAATARTRQNLALVHAMNGNWEAARIVAAQDVPADQLDARLQSWMQMANPEHPSQQVAALVGVTPAPVDPGQPVRLALHADADQPRYASLAPQRVASPTPAPSSLPAPAPSPSSLAAPVAVAAAPAPMRAPSAPAPAAALPTIAPDPAPSVYATTVDIPVRDIELVDVTAEAAAADEAETRPALDVDPVAPVALLAEAARTAREATPQPALSRQTTRLTESVRSIRAEAVAAERASRSVVQLGSYSRRSSLQRGWALATARVDALAAYQPMAARLELDGKTFYRLAAHGFASDAAARDFCVEVKQAGGECFVRKMNGDAPTRFASR